MIDHNATDPKPFFLIENLLIGYNSIILPTESL